MDKLKDAEASQAMAAVSKADPTPWQTGHAAGVVAGLRMAIELAKQAAREDHQNDQIL